MVAKDDDYIFNHDESTIHAARDPKTGVVTSLARVTAAGSDGKRQYIQRRPGESASFGSIGFKTLVGCNLGGLFTPPWPMAYCTEREMPVDSFPDGYVIKACRWLTNENSGVPDGSSPGHICLIGRKTDKDLVTPCRAVYCHWVTSSLIPFFRKVREAKGFIDLGDGIPLEHRFVQMFDGDAQQVKATCNELRELLQLNGIDPAKIPASFSLNGQLMDVHNAFRGFNTEFSSKRTESFRSERLYDEVKATFVEWAGQGECGGDLFPTLV
jgi:hypothetical protein